MPEDTVSIRVRLRDALRARKDADQVARAIDNVGDQASQAARKLARFNAASSRTRINFGPFSTSMRGGALAVGALTMATGKLTPALISTAEAATTMVGGAGAAGGVGLLGLAQGAGVARLGLGGLSDALGGNETAIKRLNPHVRRLFRTLRDERRDMRRSAQSGMLPGIGMGIGAASRNFGVLNRVVGRTGRTLGGLGADAGSMFGSAGFGRDLGTVGRSNTRIIDNLGHATLNLADASRHVIVEASPLTRWLSRMALEGSELADVWARNARNSGEMARFFREARTDLSLLGSATGHTGHGLLNLFGSQDVDGTRTLRSLDQITARFERWTQSPAVRRNVGDAIVAQIPRAVGAIMSALARNLPQAGHTAARVFLDSFMHADVWGKLLAGGWLAHKLGLFGGIGRFLNRGGGVGGGGAAGLVGRGASPMNPLFVKDVGGSITPGPGGRGLPRWVAPAGWTLGAGAAAGLQLRGAQQEHGRRAGLPRGANGSPLISAPTSATGPFGWLQEHVIRGLFGGPQAGPPRIPGRGPLQPLARDGFGGKEVIQLVVGGRVLATAVRDEDTKRRARRAG